MARVMAVRQEGTGTAQGKLECIGTVEQWDGIGLKLLLPRTWPNGALRDPTINVVRLVRANNKQQNTTNMYGAENLGKPPHALGGGETLRPRRTFETRISLCRVPG